MCKLNFIVDNEKCIHCGLCIQDCEAKIIEFNSEKIPHILKENEKHCIKCQHCLAICPNGAISIFNKNPQNSIECSNFPDSNQLLNLIKSRRSIRNYKSENLNQETMEKLKSMLKYPPTGCNDHRLHISIVENIEVMNKIRNRVNNTIKKLFLSKTLNPLTKKFDRFKNSFISGEDLIFRNAPHMIVVSTPIDAPCAPVDPAILLSYFELYAQSLGVGTLWCGYAEICFKLMPEICEILEIPQGYKVGYVMLFGPTDRTYKRSTQPEEYEITTVQADKEISLSTLDKIKRLFWNSLR
ncbi:nitroreductase family protein [bacterium]|nr:nitroreductase family protein [bacterium]